MENPIPEKEKIKYVRNLFRLWKLKIESINTTIKNIRNVFRLEKENKTIKERQLRDIRKTLDRKIK